MMNYFLRRALLMVVLLIGVNFFAFAYAHYGRFALLKQLKDVANGCDASPLQGVENADRKIQGFNGGLGHLARKAAAADLALGNNGQHLFIDACDQTQMIDDQLGGGPQGPLRGDPTSLEYSPYTTLQNILNILPGESGRLYRALMGNEEGRRLRQSPISWLHAFLACALAPAAILLSLAGLVAPVGNTMRFYCRKAAAPVRPSFPVARDRARPAAGVSPLRVPPTEFTSCRNRYPPSIS